MIHLGILRQLLVAWRPAGHDVRRNFTGPGCVRYRPRYTVCRIVNFTCCLHLLLQPAQTEAIQCEERACASRIRCLSLYSSKYASFLTSNDRRATSRDESADRRRMLRRWREYFPAGHVFFLAKHDNGMRRRWETFDCITVKMLMEKSTSIAAETGEGTQKMNEKVIRIEGELQSLFK
jgi:hypothetical protein